MMEPPPSVPSLSPAEMQILVSRTGLVLNPGQVADLVLAWRQVAMLISSIPRDRPLIDDMALSFRLPPPVPQAPAATVGAKPPERKPGGGSSARIGATRTAPPKPASRKKTAGAVRPADPKPDRAKPKPARGAQQVRRQAGAGSKRRR